MPDRCSISDVPASSCLFFFFFLDVHKLRRLICEKCLHCHMHAKCKLSLRRLLIKVVKEGNMVWGGGLQFPPYA